VLDCETILEILKHYMDYQFIEHTPEGTGSWLTLSNQLFFDRDFPEDVHEFLICGEEPVLC
jgi:hypothetical protein